jgi:hypothetical protein
MFWHLLKQGLQMFTQSQLMPGNPVIYVNRRKPSLMVFLTVEASLRSSAIRRRFGRKPAQVLQHQSEVKKSEFSPNNLSEGVARRNPGYSPE